MAYADPSGYFNHNASNKGNHTSNNSLPDDVDETETDDPTTDYLGSSELSEASVIAMAQTVGVNLNEEIANAVAELTIRKLRYATLLAMQFSAHENSSVLRVSDFSKAELEMNSPTYGHKSSLMCPEFKPIGLAKISLLDEGPEIDLLATISSDEISEINIKDLDPTFYVHHAFSNSKLVNEHEKNDQSEFSSSENGEAASFDVTEIPLLNIKEENIDDDDQIDSMSPTDENETLIPNDQNALVLFNHVNENYEGVPNDELEDEEKPSYQIRISSNCLETYTENHLDEVAENGPNNSSDSDDDAELNEMELELNEIAVSIQNEGFIFTNSNLESIVDEQTGFSSEWVDYLKVFVTCFLNNNTEDDEFPSEEEEEDDDDFDDEGFQKILDDLKKHGAYQVLEVICDFFHDYIKGLFVSVSSTGLRRIVSVINAFILSPSTPSVPQLCKMSSVLIEVFILPPPCIVQQHLTHVFMKILKHYDELLTWTCTYITEVLKKTTEVPIENLSESYKCILLGAVCLANGLEMLNIQVAQEFGWHTSILTFCRKYNDEFGRSHFSEADGYLEEEILAFCRSFLMNYKGRIPAIEMKRFHKSMKDIYGEKLVPYLCNTGNFSSKKKPISRTRRHTSSPNKQKGNYRSFNNSISPQRNSLIIRKGYWKNRKISIPYKSFLSSSV